MNLNDVKTINKKISNHSKNNKINISKFYFCPHHKNDNCYCRKPNVGLFIKVHREFNINFDNSIFIGDQISDE